MGFFWKTEFNVCGAYIAFTLFLSRLSCPYFYFLGYIVLASVKILDGWCESFYSVLRVLGKESYDLSKLVVFLLLN
jgi:hypothetical protein